ncbi:FAD-binding oxidoreductase [Agromyces aerolatus]|uniref:FAD-binding oxidoreductase n=1 Tax=Agromyces sp. LY-1074 TaxID=3074080 RepID=UPI00285C05B9|nr:MULTISPECIES: FAD-binding oxidoreductase [unclassified Agromyces]MDR5699290.1 FAD-binding oxidoreductase [Agromyces sp. LY-1074]MDR5705586.1 FAD-binding oxidoreductase [Agromyces sp. LY-1358]
MVIGRTPAGWHAATVAAVADETSTARRIVLDIPTWPGNAAGAHLDVRLTADDGYQASRSYSIASSGPGMRVLLAVAEVPEGEVSPFLVRDLRPGDRLEVHGPLGAYFVWQPPTGAPAGSPAAGLAPVQLIAGGSGIVPLFAMAMAHASAADATPFRLLYSVRTPDDVFFADELAGFAATPPPAGLDLDVVFTRVAPPGSPREPGRLTPELLADLTWPAERSPRVFVCGPTPFVETVARWLVAAGHAPDAIRTERFGGA